METRQSANIRQVLIRRCAAQGIPVSGIFELTPRCNLSCKMCYVRLTPAEMAPIGRERTVEEWLALAQQACNAGLTFLLITGGEPTLRSDFCEIYEGLAGMGLSISVNTNGTLLTQQLRELWHRLPPAQVNITLYGVCRADYEALCGDPAAFDAVVAALDWLRSEGILVHLNATMIPSNRDRWQDLEDFAKARGLELRMTTYCFPPVRRAPCGCFDRLSPEEAATLSVQDVLYREGPEALARMAAGNVPVNRDECIDEGSPMQCLAGRSQFWITWDGRMTPCGMLDQPVARPFDGDFAKHWGWLHDETAAIRLCPDCVTCDERNTCLNCAAVTYTETGRFDGKPEYMCRFNKAYRSLTEAYMK